MKPFLIKFLIRIQVVFPSPYFIIVDNIFEKAKSWELRGPPSFLYTPVGVHLSAAPWTYKRKGRYSHKYSRFNLNNMSRSCLVTFTFCSEPPESWSVVDNFFHTSLSSELLLLKVFCFVNFDWSFLENTYAFGYPRCSEKWGISYVPNQIYYSIHLACKRNPVYVYTWYFWKFCFHLC